MPKAFQGLGFISGTSAERLAHTVGVAEAGTQWFETDTSAIYVWSGSAWFRSIYSGLTPAGGDLAGTYPNPVFAAGILKIKQVLSVNYDTEFSTTNGTLSDTGLNLSITPSSTSSRIIVIATTPIRVDNSPNTGYYEAAGVVTLRRGATNLQSHGVGANFYEAGPKVFFSFSSFMYIDSPATTSAVNYKTSIKSSAPQFRIYSNASAIYGGINLDVQRSQMILVEVL